MSLISIRVILTPQGVVASSITDSSRALISSRLDSVSSRSIDPITVRKLVVVRFMIALYRSDTSYAALAASRTWKKTTPSVEIIALSLVMISCPGMSRTCSIMLTLRPTP